MNNVNRGRTWPLKILAGLLLTMAVVSCAICPPSPKKPITPRYDVYQTPGYVCFTKEDATKIFNYIQALEEGYD